MIKLDFTLDFHSHILPNIDDGAESVEKSLALIRHASEAGIKTICLTPHFYAHKRYVDSFCERRQAAYERLCDAVSATDIDMKFLLGAEILAFPNLERMDGLERMTLEGTDRILLELPLSESLITDDYFLTVEALSKKYEVIMAHANRYSDHVVENCVAAGAKIQLNVSDVCKLSQRRRIQFWQENDLVFAIGSDAHRDVSVYKKFKKANKILSR